MNEQIKPWTWYPVSVRPPIEDDPESMQHRKSPALLLSVNMNDDPSKLTCFSGKAYAYKEPYSQAEQIDYTDNITDEPLVDVTHWMLIEPPKV